MDETMSERGGHASKEIGRVEERQMHRKHLFCINGAAEFLEILRALFEDEHYNVTTTNYVPRTFEQIESLQPDGIIVDLAVTHQAGWGLLERLASEAGTRDIPVVIVSTDQTILDEVSLNPARYGGRAHLVKPLDIDVLVETVHRLVGTA